MIKNVHSRQSYGDFCLVAAPAVPSIDEMAQTWLYRIPSNYPVAGDCVCEEDRRLQTLDFNGYVSAG